MNSFKKSSPQIKAAAELELRRRHAQRGKDCALCSIIKTVSAEYGGPETARVCPHNAVLNETLTTNLAKIDGTFLGENNYVEENI